MFEQMDRGRLYYATYRTCAKKHMQKESEGDNANGGWSESAAGSDAEFSRFDYWMSQAMGAEGKLFFGSGRTPAISVQKRGVYGVT